MEPNYPQISIVIPCRNERDYIGRCLDSIINCNYDKNNLNVLVCDGLSDDGTVEIIKKYNKEFPYIHYLENIHKSTPNALNIGLKKLTFDIGIILGAHAEIDANYLRNCVAAFEKQPDASCVGGIIFNVNESETSEAIGLAMSSVFGVGNAHFRTGAKSGYVDTVAFGAYKKEIFEKCGYFDEELVRNQDDEFNYRILKNGFKIWLEPSIQSKYYVRASFSKLGKQYFQYGYWKVYVNRKHKAVTTGRQLVPALWVLCFFTSFIPGLLFTPLLYLYYAILVLYLLASVGAAIKTTNKLSLFPNVLFSFWILHFSYGIGYLLGIWDFFILRKTPSTKQTSLTR